MKKQSNYWKKRVLAAEINANARGTTLLQEIERIYVVSYNEVVREIERLAANANISTATEVWQYERLVDLERRLALNIEAMSTRMAISTEKALSSIYMGAAADFADMFGNEFIAPNEFQVKAVVNEVYYDSNYSERIWKHNSQLGGRIKTDIERLVATGENPQKIAATLQKDYNVAFSDAERLIRTEASRVYAQATEDSYKRYGIEENEFLAEPGACSVCKALDKKKFKVGEGPKNPQHPRCRCVYLPVI